MKPLTKREMAVTIREALEEWVVLQLLSGNQ